MPSPLEPRFISVRNQAFCWLSYKINKTCCYVFVCCSWTLSLEWGEITYFHLIAESVGCSFSMVDYKSAWLSSLADFLHHVSGLSLGSLLLWCCKSWVAKCFHWLVTFAVVKRPNHGHIKTRLSNVWLFHLAQKWVRFWLPFQFHFKSCWLIFWTL